ncbi:MAG: YceD family protein [Bacteroidota bacterium]
MRNNSPYIIPFKGLKEGLHEFRYRAGGELFTDYPAADVLHADLDIRVEMIKKPRLLEMEFSITGFVEVVCDRCLDRYNHVIDTTGTLFFKFGEYSHEETSEIIVLKEEEYQVDIMHYIYEFSMLALPVKKIHPRKEDNSSGCNTEMEKILEQHSVQNTKNTDPRWNALKNINNEN